MTHRFGKCAEKATDYAKSDNNLDSSAVSIADFAGFASETLAEFCRIWPGTNEARAARAELIGRRALAYSEMCRKPWVCISKGFCPLDPNCAD